MRIEGNYVAKWKSDGNTIATSAALTRSLHMSAAAAAAEATASDTAALDGALPEVPALRVTTAGKATSTGFPSPSTAAALP